MNRPPNDSRPVRWPLPWLLLVALAVVIVDLWGIDSAARSESPRGVVTAFADALAAGDVSGAIAVGGIEFDEAWDRSLLADSVYAKADRPEVDWIGSAKTVGDSSTMSVAFSAGTKFDYADVGLKKVDGRWRIVEWDGHDFSLAITWPERVGVRDLQLDDGAVIAGVGPPGRTFAVLPGVYGFTLMGTDDFVEEHAGGLVAPDGLPADVLTFEGTPTKAMRTTILAAVNKALTECVRLQGSGRSLGCPYEMRTKDGEISMSGAPRLVIDTSEDGACTPHGSSKTWSVCGGGAMTVTDGTSTQTKPFVVRAEVTMTKGGPVVWIDS